MPQGTATSVTLRSTEFNEEDVISSSHRLTAEKGFGRQRRGHFSRNMMETGNIGGRKQKEDLAQRRSQVMFL